MSKLLNAASVGRGAKVGTEGGDVIVGTSSITLERLSSGIVLDTGETEVVTTGSKGGASGVGVIAAGGASIVATIDPVVEMSVLLVVVGKIAEVTETGGNPITGLLVASTGGVTKAPGGGVTNAVTVTVVSATVTVTISTIETTVVLRGKSVTGVSISVVCGLITGIDVGTVREVVVEGNASESVGAGIRVLDKSSI